MEWKEDSSNLYLYEDGKLIFKAFKAIYEIIPPYMFYEYKGTSVRCSVSGMRGILLAFGLPQSHEIFNLLKQRNYNYDSDDEENLFGEMFSEKE